MKKNYTATRRAIVRLRQNVAYARPYRIGNGEGSAESEAIEFPDSPGIYLILRRCVFPQRGYRFHGVSTRSPVVLYVGKTTPKRTIRRRLHDHFGLARPNYQGSQFAKILLQIIQDEIVVEEILSSRDTLIACLPVSGSNERIDALANAAIEEFKPRFNVRGR